MRRAALMRLPRVEPTRRAEMTRLRQGSTLSEARRLPALRGTPHASTRAMHLAHAVGPADMHLRVVVAEDDLQMRQLVAEVLRKDGFEVEEIADGRQLLMRVVEAFLPWHSAMAIDLLISDVCMPFFSGLDVLRKLRLNRWQTPVLLMTAFGDPSLSLQVRNLNAVLLDKPFTRAALKTAVRELLALAPQD